mmetsp:Transcript_12782/g.14578  ORF Transcript_12782/g.14578 Transcript_12782/m.14578 type:complete len:124 (+) Transcript_12782:1-372(+)
MNFEDETNMCETIPFEQEIVKVKTIRVNKSKLLYDKGRVKSSDFAMPYNVKPAGFSEFVQGFLSVEIPEAKMRHTLEKVDREKLRLKSDVKPRTQINGFDSHEILQNLKRTRGTTSKDKKLFD